MQSGGVQEIPRFIVMRLEEEINERQLIDRHAILYAYRQRVNGLGYVHSRYDLCTKHTVPLFPYLR